MKTQLTLLTASFLATFAGTLRADIVYCSNQSTYLTLSMDRQKLVAQVDNDLGDPLPLARDLSLPLNIPGYPYTVSTTEFSNLGCIYQPNEGDVLSCKSLFSSPVAFLHPRVVITTKQSTLDLKRTTVVDQSGNRFTTYKAKFSYESVAPSGEIVRTLHLIEDMICETLETP